MCVYRHVGDLGNVHEAEDGTVNTVIRDDVITLSGGDNSVIQRTVVVCCVSDVCVSTYSAIS